MKEFLKKLGSGLLKLLAAFVLLAVGARFVPSLNWFFFQKNEHDRVFYTLLETERAIAEGKQFDVLLFGSSTCENAIDPFIFKEKTGLSIFKCVTGAQTIDMSVVLARYLAPKFRCKYVIIDAYPRFGGNLTDEGVERALINSPQASSALTREILSVDPSSLTTDYLWLARAIGTSIKPYDATDIVPKPWEFEMVAPGFTHTHANYYAPPRAYFEEPLVAEAVQSMNLLQKDLAAIGQRFVAIIPPLQNARVRLEAAPEFPTIVPTPRPDSCFFDGRHMRTVCVPPYTLEIVERFNAYRSTVEGKP